MQTRRHGAPAALVIRLAGLAALLASALAGCSAAAPQGALIAGLGAVPEATATSTAQPSPRGIGGTLRILFWQAPVILNPHLTTGAKDWAACRVTYEPLASFDKDGNLVPFLAAEIPSIANGDVAQDGKSVIWKLRHDVRWSDGQPFTADDVRFTYQYITNPQVKATTAATYAAVSSVDVLDRYTVRVNFKDVNPAWSLPFVGIPGMIIPQHVFEKYNGPNASAAPANMLPVGTGAYRVVSFKPEEVLFLGNTLIETNKIVYEPNPFFRDPNKPYFSRVELQGGGTVNEAARSVFQFGDVDYANNLTIDSNLQKQLESYGKATLVAPFGAFVERILLNRTDPNRATADGERSSTQFPNPFFEDKRVRQAFAYAIDRQAIAALYGPTGTPTQSILVSPATYLSTEPGYEYDPYKAASLLDEAGWVMGPDNVRVKNSVRLSVSFQTSANSVRQQTQDIVKKSLERIGVEVRLTFYDSSVYFDDNPNNPNNRHHFYADMEMYSTGNRSPYPGPYMQSWICSEIAQKANNWTGLNKERFCNPAYDNLYQATTLTLDPVRSRELFVQMNHILVDDVVDIPLVRQADISGVSKTLIGVELTPWDADLWKIQDWRR